MTTVFVVLGVVLVLALVVGAALFMRSRSRASEQGRRQAPGGYAGFHPAPSAHPAPPLRQPVVKNRQTPIKTREARMDSATDALDAVAVSWPDVGGSETSPAPSHSSGHHGGYSGSHTPSHAPSHSYDSGSSHSWGGGHSSHDSGGGGFSGGGDSGGGGGGGGD